MHTKDVLTDTYNRISRTVHRACAEADSRALVFRPAADANSIAWLVWHLTRVQDEHISGVAGREPAWTAEGWRDSFGLPFDASDTGFGHTSEQVGDVRPDAQALLGYHDAVSQRTMQYLETVDADELDRVIDTSHDPPVTVGSRLVGVISDNLQHAGQARYVRGIADGHA